jgi:hypothetical protein
MNSFLQEFCQEMRGIKGMNAQNENKNNKSVEKMDRSKVTIGIGRGSRP